MWQHLFFTLILFFIIWQFRRLWIKKRLRDEADRVLAAIAEYSPDAGRLALALSEELIYHDIEMPRVCCTPGQASKIASLARRERARRMAAAIANGDCT